MTRASTIGCYQLPPAILLHASDTVAVVRGRLSTSLCCIGCHGLLVVMLSLRMWPGNVYTA